MFVGATTSGELGRNCSSVHSKYSAEQPGANNAMSGSHMGHWQPSLSGKLDENRHAQQSSSPGSAAAWLWPCWPLTLDVLQVRKAVEQSAKQLKLSHKPMVSRAYHDSLFMAQLAPTGMIFIPCKNGWSHRPDEFSSASDIENGVKTLALTLAALAGEAPALATSTGSQEL